MELLLLATTYTPLPENVNITLIPTGVAIGGILGAIGGWRLRPSAMPTAPSFIGAIFGATLATLFWMIGMALSIL